MSTVLELENEVLALPVREREQLATLVWESLVSDPQAAGDPGIDPDGIELAAQRDAEIEAHRAQPIGHDEFLRRTGAASR